MWKENMKVRHIALFITAFVVCACILMSGNIIFGRYLSVFSADAAFSATSADRAYLYNSDGDNATEILWPTGSYAASFIVTNYIATATPARQDLSVKIRIVVPDIQEYKNLEFTINDDDATYEAYPVYLSANAPLYSECVDWYKNKSLDEDTGFWVYYFNDTSGSEVRWLLPGGNISERKFDLAMYPGNNEIDTSNLMIDIIEVQNQKGAIQQ